MLKTPYFYFSIIFAVIYLLVTLMYGVGFWSSDDPSLTERCLNVVLLLQTLYGLSCMSHLCVESGSRSGRGDV